MKKIGYLLLCCLLLAGGGLLWVNHQVEKFAAQPLLIETETIFTLPAGTGRVGLQALLLQEHLVAQAHWLPWLLRLQPELSRFKAGTYRLQPGLQVRQLLQLLASGKEAQFSILFTEGTTVREWLMQLWEQPYLDHQLGIGGKAEEEIVRVFGVEHLAQLEGRFYPDTYFFTAGTSDIALLQRAQQRMQKILDDVWQQRAPSLPYQTPLELLTMASIIEKETGIDAERGKVASVFVNRLRLGMRLQTDPTVIYGKIDRHFNITRADLQQETPYNTYVIYGLPPTPIAMPGRASLEAAAHPLQSDYLYFVADGKGGHTFTTNLASHNKARQVYREAIKNQKAQEQRSLELLQQQDQQPSREMMKPQNEQ